jgi:hypothetical protein
MSECEGFPVGTCKHLSSKVFIWVGQLDPTAPIATIRDGLQRNTVLSHLTFIHLKQRLQSFNRLVRALETKFWTWAAGVEK